MSLGSKFVLCLKNVHALKSLNFRLTQLSGRRVSENLRGHLSRNLGTYSFVCSGSAGFGFILYCLKATSNEVLSVTAEENKDSHICEAFVQNESVKKSFGNFNLLSFRTVLGFISSDLPFLIMALLGAFGAAYYNVRIPLLFGELVSLLSELSQSSNFPISSLRAPSLRLCSAFCLQSTCTFMYIGMLATVGEALACRLRKFLFEHILYQRISFFDTYTANALMERMISDVQDYKSAFKMTISQGLRCIAQLVGSTVAMYTISPALTFALFGSLPLVFLAGSLFGSQLRYLSLAARAQDEAATKIASQMLTHIRTVKSLAMESVLLSAYIKESDEARCMHEVLGYGIGYFQGLSNLALNGVVLGVLYVGGNLMLKNQLDAGQLMAFLVATQSVHRYLGQISLLYGHMVRGVSAATRISELFSFPDPSEAANLTFGLSALKVWRDLQTNPLLDSSQAPAPVICFENVSFAYPSRPETLVFDNLCFEVPAGKVVAFVGESGAGKSTVLALLERFHDPITGRILIGGTDLRDLSLSSLRGRLLGYISQDAEIFHQTILDNISYARPGASFDEIHSAAVKAQADQFVVSELPEQYLSVVGGGSSTTGLGLSGGQRQRLVIARAFLKDAPILLLDEATSALDAESEFQVQSALQRAMSGRTVLIVAHRLSTIRKADLIFVMHKGRIVEQGTHDDLLKKKGRYYKLLQRQSDTDFLT